MTATPLVGAKVRSLKRNPRSGFGPTLFLAPALILTAVFFIAPLALTIVMSAFKWPLFGSKQFIGVDNYLRALSDPTVRSSLLFTVAFTLVATICTVLAGFGLAFLVSGGRPGTGVIRTSIFLPVVVGMASASFLWIYLLNPDVGIIPHLMQVLGWTDTVVAPLSTTWSALLAIGLMTVWKSAGFSMLLFLIGLQAIPTELAEASAIDGASAWQRLVSITLPLLRPTIALVLVLQVTQNFLAFEQFFLMTKGGPQNSTITISYWVYSKAFVNYQLGYGAALATLVLVLLVLLNAVQLRAIRADQT